MHYILKWKHLTAPFSRPLDNKSGTVNFKSIKTVSERQSVEADQSVFKENTEVSLPVINFLIQLQLLLPVNERSCAKRGQIREIHALVVKDAWVPDYQYFS